jgi:isoamylase
MSGELAHRLRGSADIFEWSGRTPTASINFVTSHDGFTLADVVSYEHRHNEANGEDNKDGHTHNYSRNYGAEGPTDDESIRAVRRRQRLNMLATLLFSAGTPMLLAGDEFGQTQGGNNNAYAQDNETTWLDWSRLDEDPEFPATVRELVALRRDLPLLRLGEFLHGRQHIDGRATEIDWYAPEGARMDENAWTGNNEICFVISDVSPEGGRSGIAVAINGSPEDCRFTLPGKQAWRLVFCSGPASAVDDRSVRLPGLSIALLQCDAV